MPGLPWPRAPVVPKLLRLPEPLPLPLPCPSFPGFHMYYPSRRQLTPALRAFVDAMKQRA